jgi:hypothetical protein
MLALLMILSQYVSCTVPRDIIQPPTLQKQRFSLTLTKVMHPDVEHLGCQSQNGGMREGFDTYISRIIKYRIRGPHGIFIFVYFQSLGTGAFVNPI